MIRSRDSLFAALRLGLVLIVGGTLIAGFHFDSLTDAAWFTVQTLTTTGYGSFDPAVWTPGLKWLSILMMLVAAPLWAYAIAVLVRHLIPD